ncbi:MAG TPA: hypothetical protein VEY89_07065, partial [Candidatus Dormibacteraeota bacterium]|nr:hypothetical protein [Candidatus Dormibacteraeota bacterium]
MHLAQRGYLLVVLTAVLAVVAIWSAQPDGAPLWRIPAGLLLLGLAVDGFIAHRLPLSAGLALPARLFLGRPQPTQVVFANATARALTLDYAPAMPPGIEPLPAIRRVHAPPGSSASDAMTLLPVRLGLQIWPALPTRVLGPLGLAWWNRVLLPAARVVVAPDTLRTRLR